MVQKAAECQGAVSPFQAYYGEDETVGIKDIIHTDWQLSTASPDANSHPPPMRMTPNQSLISQSWAQRYGSTNLMVLPDPPTFTILSLKIPNDDLELKDILYYADLEDHEDSEDDRDVEGVVGDGASRSA